MLEGSCGFGGIPEPELIVRDESDRILPWSLRGGSTDEAAGEVEVRDLPDIGEIEVEVVRLMLMVFDEEVAEDSYDGPWTFSFST